ncbi:hypothetical protein SASPL_121747 [Salvia splendens]|uniref:Uncharacterized protein n=1 Tax=Salvia splendens TaxID=180675 RepID=A0A8X8XWP2_SALSN|nr:hypothetical protein SASPL_121747 [Salvia splendens]
MTTVLETCGISPPPGSTSDLSLPLCFFDIIWIHYHPIRRLLFYNHPCSEAEFSNTIVPNLKHFLPVAGNLLYHLDNDKSRPLIRYVSGDSTSLTVAVSGRNFDDLTGSHIKESDQFYDLLPPLPSATDDGNYKIAPLVAMQATLFPGRGICVGMSTASATPDPWVDINRHGGDKRYCSPRLHFPPSLWAKFMFRKYCHKAVPSKAPFNGNQTITWKRMARAGQKIHKELLWSFEDGEIFFWEDIWRSNRPLSVWCNLRMSLRQERVKDYWVNGEWNSSLLNRNLVRLGVPRWVVDEIERTPIEEGGRDILRWSRSAHREFTSSAWELCRHRHPHTPPNIDRVSTFVVATAYVWTTLAKSLGPAGDEDEVFFIGADGTGRRNALFDTPVPVNYFGNCLGVGVVRAEYRKLAAGDGFVAIVEAIVDTIKTKFYDGDSGRVTRYLVSIECDQVSQELVRRCRNIRALAMTGSPKFDYAEADFGWGEAQKVEVLSLDGGYSMSLSNSGDGDLVVGVLLTKEEMEAFASMFATSLYI